MVDLLRLDDDTGRASAVEADSRATDLVGVVDHSCMEVPGAARTVACRPGLDRHHRASMEDRWD